MNINGQEYKSVYLRIAGDTGVMIFNDPITGELLSPWGGAGLTIINWPHVYTARISQVTADFDLPAAYYDLVDVKYLGEVHMP